MTRLNESILTCHLSSDAGLFDYADEDILEREARLARRHHPYACLLQLSGDTADRLVHRLGGDDMHAIAEERDPPAVHNGFESIGRELRRRHLQLDETARQLAFDAGR